MKIAMLQTIYQRCEEYDIMQLIKDLVPNGKKALIVDSEMTTDEWADGLGEDFGALVHSNFVVVNPRDAMHDICDATIMNTIGVIIVNKMKSFVHHDIRAIEECFYSIMERTDIPVYFIEERSARKE